MILILADNIVTQNKNRDIIKNGAIFINDSKIEDIGNADIIRNKYAKKIKRTIKASGGVAMPGLVNAHTHLAMALLRGYADDLPLERWWFDLIHPVESKFTREKVYLGSLLGALEMVKSGTTTFVDQYYFMDEVGKAAETIGLRANLGAAVLDFETFAFKNAEEILKDVPRLSEKWKNNPLIKISLAPHMLQTTSLSTYKKCKKIAKKHGLLLQTHLAETKEGIEHSIKNYEKTPTKLLTENKILDKQTLAAHCCHMNADDIKLLSAAKASVAHCPSSNMKLSSGVMPFSKLKKAGVNICLGTDGACSNNSLDMFSEMKIAALLHKCAENDPTAADAQTILDMATINGARALHMENEIGSIETGKKADIIVLDCNQPHLLPQHNIISNLVYAGRGSDVVTAIINGRIIMENRKILSVNERSTIKESSAGYSNL
jgi:5-methylthioadenosine/S-adenosylhomocysteine deaminase